MFEHADGLNNDNKNCHASASRVAQGRTAGDVRDRERWQGGGYGIGMGDSPRSAPAGWRGASRAHAAPRARSRGSSPWSCRCGRQGSPCCFAAVVLEKRAGCRRWQARAACQWSSSFLCQPESCEDLSRKEISRKIEHKFNMSPIPSARLLGDWIRRASEENPCGLFTDDDCCRSRFSVIVSTAKKKWDSQKQQTRCMLCNFESGLSELP